MEKAKKGALLLIVLIWVSVSASVKIDSLKQQLTITSGMDHANTLLELSQEYLYVDASQAYDYATRAFYDTKDLKTITLNNDALVLMATAEEFRGNIDSALAFHTQALNQASDAGLPDLVARASLNLSLLYIDLSHYAKALDLAQQAYDGFEKSNDKSGMAKALNNIGNIYLYLERYDLAQKNYEESMTLKRKTGDASGVAIEKHNIALVYLKTNRTDEALSLLQNAVAMFDSLDAQYDKAIAYMNIATLMYQNKEYSKALEVAEKAYRLLQRLSVVVGLDEVNLLIGEIYFGQKEYQKSMIYSRQAEKVSTQLQNRFLLEQVYRNISKIFHATKESDSAYVYLLKSQDMRDSLNARETIKLITKQEAQREIKSKEVELAALQNLHLAEKRGRLYLLFFLIVLLTSSIIVAMAFFRLQRESLTRISAENLHKEAESKLRHFMNSITEIFNIYDSNLRLIEINTAGLAIFPPGTTREDLLGKHITELVPDIETSGRLKNYQQVLNTGVPFFSNEIQLDDTFGNRYMQVHAFAFSSHLGMVITDISQYKKVQIKLEESEAEMQAIFNALDDIMIIFDKDATYLRIAQNNPRYLIRPVNELLGKTVDDFFDIGMAKMFHKTIQTCLRTRDVVEIDYRLPMPEGTQVFSAKCTPFLQDKVVMVIRNITDRFLMTQELREKERLNRAIVEHSPLGISLRDRFGRLLMANDSWVALMQPTPEELEEDKRPRKQFALPISTEKNLGSYLDDFKRLLENGGKLYIPDLKIKGENDKKRWVTQYCYALMQGNNKVDKVVIMSENVTRQHEFTAAIESSLREKEVLLKELHHRVKNNMQVILSMVKLQSKSVKDPHYHQMFVETQNRVLSMALVHEKLYQSPSLEKINFNEYITSLITSLSHSINVVAHHISYDVDATATYLSLDKAVPCGLLLNEVVSNAFKHAFPDNQRGELTVSLHKQKGHLVLCVADNGVGFPSDFDIEKSTSLGMQLIYALANQLHATVAIQVNNGSSFTFTFPIKDA